MSTPPPAVTPARLGLALVAAFGTGILVALQTRLNGELGQRLGDGFLAAFISFGSGFVILALASLVWRPGRRGISRVVTALRERSIPWWLVLGGIGGALFVLGQGLTVGMLGVAMYTIAVLCGQTVSSLVLDHRGLALMPATPATPQRIVGAVLAVVAVGIALSDRIRPDIPVWALVIPLVPMGTALLFPSVTALASHRAFAFNFAHQAFFYQFLDYFIDRGSGKVGVLGDVLDGSKAQF